LRQLQAQVGSEIIQRRVLSVSRPKPLSEKSSQAITGMDITIRNMLPNIDYLQLALGLISNLYMRQTISKVMDDRGRFSLLTLGQWGEANVKAMFLHPLRYRRRLWLISP